MFDEAKKLKPLPFLHATSNSSWERGPGDDMYTDRFPLMFDVAKKFTVQWCSSHFTSVTGVYLWQTIQRCLALNKERHCMVQGTAVHKLPEPLMSTEILSLDLVDTTSKPINTSLH